MAGIDYSGIGQLEVERPSDYSLGRYAGGTSLTLTTPPCADIKGPATLADPDKFRRLFASAAAGGEETGDPPKGGKSNSSRFDVKASTFEIPPVP